MDKPLPCLCGQDHTTQRLESFTPGGAAWALIGVFQGPQWGAVTRWPCQTFGLGCNPAWKSPSLGWRLNFLSSWKDESLGFALR